MFFFPLLKLVLRKQKVKMKHLEIIPPGLQEFIWLHFNAETLQNKADSNNKAPIDR